MTGIHNMTTETQKLYTLSINEVQDVLEVDKDLEKSAIQDKLNSLKQYPKSIYNLDDLKAIYELPEFAVEKAKTYIEKRNAERGKKAQATRAANKAKVAKEEKKAKSKPTNDFDELGKLYAQQAKLKVEIAKLSQEQNLLDKKIIELEKQMNVR